MSAAPIEKFAAMRALAGRSSPNSSENDARSSSLSPVVPTTAWTECSAHQRRFSRAADATVKSTATSAPACSIASASAATSRSATSSLNAPSTLESRSPARPGSTTATSSRSPAEITARQTVAPMRPPAPKTPTRITAEEPMIGAGTASRLEVRFAEGPDDGEDTGPVEHAGCTPRHVGQRDRCDLAQ